MIDKVVRSPRSKDVPRPTIAHGKAKFSAGASRNRPTLVKRIRDSFQKLHDVRMIDELSTSNKCPRCNNFVQEVRGKA